MLHALPLLLALVQSASPQAQKGLKGTPATPGQMYLSCFNADVLARYRIRDGQPRSDAPMPGSQSITLGPDGLLYVCAEKVDEVRRVDPTTMELVDVFVGDDPGTPEDENGPLDGPTAACFGPGGDLFVASFDSDEILRFDGATGAYLGVFVSAGLGGLNGPDAGTKFGSDGNLYVPSFFGDNVLRYAPDGAFLGEFIPFRRGNLREPRDLVEHHGEWYVASSRNSRVLRFDALGNYLGVFATVSRPYSLAFHPVDGDLYVVSLLTNTVEVADGTTGVHLRTAVTAPVDAGAVYLYFLPER